MSSPDIWIPGTPYTQELSHVLEQAQQRLEPKTYELLRSLIRPGIVMLKGNSTRSFIGGKPELPDSSHWPTHNDIPYVFMGQVDLSDIPDDFPADQRGGLPTTGLLVLFHLNTYDVDWVYPDAKWNADKDFLAKVLYFPQDAALQVIDFPEALDSSYHFEKSPRKLFVCPTFPDIDDLASYDIEEDSDDDWWEFQEDFGERYLGYGELHLLLGNANPIQGPLAKQTANIFQKTTAEKDIRLLAQFGSDEEIGSMWGDAGNIYFAIRQDDLDAFNLDDVAGMYDCS